MEELSNKDKEDAGYPYKTKTLLKNIMILHFKNNVIRFTLTNILFFEKTIVAEKEDVKIKTSTELELLQINFIALSAEYI